MQNVRILFQLLHEELHFDSANKQKKKKEMQKKKRNCRRLSKSRV